MSSPRLLDTLRELEVRLHGHEVRSDPAVLGQVLHPAFREFGRSGRCYTRAQVLAELAETPQAYVIWSQDWKIDILDVRTALLTYRSAHMSQSGELERHTLRASLWQFTPHGWKMRFHQGTPTGGFERHAV